MTSDKEMRDQWQVAQQLVNAAVEEIYNEKEERASWYKPYGGIFDRKPDDKTTGVPQSPLA
jgi:hypothetical protein